MCKIGSPLLSFLSCSLCTLLQEVIDSWMIPKLIQAVNSINVGVKKYRYIYFVTLCEILVFDTEHDECAGIDIAGGRKLDGLGEKARKIVEAGEKR